MVNTKTLKVIKNIFLPKEQIISFPFDYFKFSRDTHNIVITNYGQKSIIFYSLHENDAIDYNLQTFNRKIIKLYEMRKSISDYYYYKNNSIFFMQSEGGAILILRKIDDTLPTFKIISSIRCEESISFQLLMNNNDYYSDFKVNQSQIIQPYLWNKQKVRDEEIELWSNNQERTIDYLAVSCNDQVGFYKIEGISNHPHNDVVIKKFTHLILNVNQLELIKFMKTRNREYLLIFKDEADIIRNARIYEEDEHFEIKESNRFLKTYSEISFIMFNYTNTKFLIKEKDNLIYVANSMMMMKKLFIFPRVVTNLAWIFKTNIFSFIHDGKYYFTNYKDDNFKDSINDMNDKIDICPFIPLEALGFEADEEIDRIYYTEISTNYKLNQIRTNVLVQSKNQYVVIDLEINKASKMEIKKKILKRVEHKENKNGFFYKRTFFSIETKGNQFSIKDLESNEIVYSLLLDSPILYNQFLDKFYGRERLIWITNGFVDS